MDRGEPRRNRPVRNEHRGRRAGPRLRAGPSPAGPAARPRRPDSSRPSRPRCSPSAASTASRRCCRTRRSSSTPTSARRRCSPRRSRGRSRRSRTCCSSSWTRRPACPLDDVVEVSNYVAALEHGLARLREGFPLSNRLIREIHGVLLSRGRGSGKDPGEFRRSQNWIGGTRPGQRRLRAAAAHGGARLHGDARALPARRGRRPAGPRARRARARPVRDDPPVPRRQRPRRPAADHLPALSGRRAARAAPLPEPLLQAAPRGLLRAARPGAPRRATGRRGSTFFLEGVRITAEGAVATAQRLAEMFQDDRRGSSRRGAGRVRRCACTRRSRRGRSSR